MSESSPSKELVVPEECEPDQVERMQNESRNLVTIHAPGYELTIDIPFLLALELFGYTIIGDNIDKNVSPRNMTVDHQLLSLRYFQY